MHLVKGAPAPPGGDAASLRVMRHIRAMVGVMAVVHVVVLLMIVTGAGRAWMAVSYYRPYLSDPLLGEQVRETLLNVEATLAAVRNITAILSTGTAALATSFGVLHAPLAAPPPASPPAPAWPPARRALLQDSPAAGAAAALFNCSRLQESLAGLADSLANNSRQFDASAPSDFLRWVVETSWASELGPYVHELLAVARYGEALGGALFQALGTKVDPSIVGYIAPAFGVPRRGA